MGIDGLRGWAARHSVTHAALGELLQLLAAPPAPAVHPVADVSEAAVQAAVRLVAPRGGALLWRNNVGVAVGADGVPIRFGLANDSKRLNEKVKSSDLIGVVPMRILPGHVGQTLGLFVAAECKRGAWRWTATSRETAQHRFMELVNAAGGVAGFVRGPEDFTLLIKSRMEI